MNWNRRFLVLGVALALAMGVSCTSGEMPLDTQIEGEVPTAEGGMPTGDDGVPTGDGEGVPTGDGGDMSGQVGLLSCEPQAYAATTAVIGPKGGQINVGDHNLKILEYALSEDVTITAEQIEGTVNSVRLSPEGLRFAVPAVLTLSYGNCVNVLLPKRLVYTDELLTIIEPLLSLDFTSIKKVKGLIGHFSRYAVAY